MARKPVFILPIASALAALGFIPATTAPSEAKLPDQTVDARATTKTAPSDLQPNSFITVGEDLLGFIITEQADGRLLAQHYSHSSHASHASHHSHYSGR